MIWYLVHKIRSAEFKTFLYAKKRVISTVHVSREREGERGGGRARIRTLL